MESMNLEAVAAVVMVVVAAKLILKLWVSISFVLNTLDTALDHSSLPIVERLRIMEERPTISVNDASHKLSPLR